MSERPDSPCKGVCTTLYTEFCLGCGRHYLEVAHWVSMTQEEKDAVWDRLVKLTQGGFNGQD